MPRYKEPAISDFDNPQSNTPNHIQNTNLDDMASNNAGDFPSSNRLNAEINKVNESLAEKYMEVSGFQKSVEPNKRLIALLIDLIVCYVASVLISVVVSLIPLLPNLLPQPIILVLLFMSRDYFFGGHGIGKNLMGLKVIDSTSGRPITLKQSFLRNITLTAPLIVMELIGMLPGAILPGFIRDIFNILETLYSVVFLPLESYRAYSREDSLRIGDQIAQTRIVHAQTNFEQFVPKKRN